MTSILKQSTAVDVLIGPFLDLTDAATPETGESPSVKLSKNGQTLAAKNDVTTPVHDADGYYNCELDATDTNTVGTLVLTVAASANALPVRHEFQVVEESTYDALFAASATGFDANGRVDVGSWLGNAVTFGTGGPDVNVNAISDDATAAANLEADYDGTGFNKSNSTIGTCTTNTDMRGTDNAATAAALATVDTNVDAILVDTGTTIPAQITALNDPSVNDLLTTQLAEAASADGAAPTVQQALYEIVQFLQERSVSGTTVTVTQSDGSTSLMTFTLNDDTNPTSITRAS